MQPKRSPLLLATGLLGVLALGGLAFVFLKPGGQGAAPNPAAVAQPTPTSAPTTRWIALNDIPPRTRVTREMLTRQTYTEKDGAPKDGIKDPSDINGEITNEPIMRGEPVTLASFTPGIKRATPANIEIPTGTRAVAIYVDPNSTAAGLVDVGDYVDVVAVHKLTWDKGKNQFVVGALQYSTGRLVGSNLKVLAVEKSLNAPAATPTPVPNAPGANVANGPPPPPTPVPPPAAAPTKIRVLLAAPVTVATHLIAAGDQGTLNIIIRNPLDTDTVDATNVPEAREYPSRLITMAEPKTGGGSPSGGGSSKRDREPLMPPMNTMVVPTLPPPAIPTQPARPLAPVGPPTSDITVIRGTEKTRVIVPQR